MRLCAGDAENPDQFPADMDGGGKGRAYFLVGMREIDQAAFRGDVVV
jgi:hypothetical protein